jgi:hypothetical protein
VVIKAVEAKNILYRHCSNGTLSQQSAKMQSDIAELLAAAEKAESTRRRHDPVVRIALAHLALSLDDALALEQGGRGERVRLSVLRKAAGRAASVAEWLPECPGPQRLLSHIRARMADLENKAAWWDLAIDASMRAHALDPGDSTAAERLWILHVRAGRHSEAREWQARVERAMGACPAVETN